MATSIETWQLSNNLWSYCIVKSENGEQDRRWGNHLYFSEEEALEVAKERAGIKPDKETV